MEFADEISIVIMSWPPVDEELLLGNTVTNPVKAHVDGFLFDANIGEANGCGIVNLDGGGWLGMAHFAEGETKGKGVFGGEEGGADFCFGCGAHHVLEYFAENMDDSVAEGHGRVGGVREVVAEEEDASRSATGFGFGEVGSVAVDVEDHVAWVVAN